MIQNGFDFIGGNVLGPNGFRVSDLSLADGLVAAASTGGRGVDLTGWAVLPGIIDLHGDGFERHVAPRRGAMLQLEDGLVSLEAELAANGVTTAVLAQFFSWEGGLRSPDFSERLVDACAQLSASFATDLKIQLRLETHLIDDYARAEALIDRASIPYVAFNDHLPHDRLAAGKKPPRLTGQALKSGRSPEAHLALLHRLHERSADVPAALGALAKRLTSKGVIIASHDDTTAKDRQESREIGALVSEFPETMDAASEARNGGDFVVLGAPNVVRGGSHKGNASARDLVRAGLCDGLASDYHYPSPLKAAFLLAREAVVSFEQAWALLSSGPAKVLGLTDRGVIAPGKRADLVIVDLETGRVGATLAKGRVTYLTTPLAERFLAQSTSSKISF